MPHRGTNQANVVSHSYQSNNEKLYDIKWYNYLDILRAIPQYNNT